MNNVIRNIRMRRKQFVISLVFLQILIFSKLSYGAEGEKDADGFLYAKWGMSIAQVREAFEFEFKDPKVTINTSPPGVETYLSTLKAENLPFSECMVEHGYTFKFRSGELYQVVYLWQTPAVFSKEKGPTGPACGAMIFHRFSVEVDSLFKEYGRPVKDEKYKKIWVLPSTSILIKFINLGDWYLVSLEYEKR